MDKKLEAPFFAIEKSTALHKLIEKTIEKSVKNGHRHTIFTWFTQ